MFSNLLKITNKTILSKAAIVLALSAIVVANAKIISDNIVASQGIDEAIVAEANPRLNKKLLQNAISTLESFATGELTSSLPADTVENEATKSGENEQKSTTVEIQNASGVLGAASDLAERLSLIGYQISAVSTAPSLEGQTTVTYKAGKAAEAQEIVDVLNSQDWPIGASQQASQDQPYDVVIILGK